MFNWSPYIYTLSMVCTEYSVPSTYTVSMLITVYVFPLPKLDFINRYPQKKPCKDSTLSWDNVYFGHYREKVSERKIA